MTLQSTHAVCAPDSGGGWARDNASPTHIVFYRHDVSANAIDLEILSAAYCALREFVAQVRNRCYHVHYSLVLSNIEV